MAAAPLYDPKVHTVDDGDPMVYVEQYCVCGGIMRQRDPVSYVLPRVTDWQARHAGGNHGEATKAQFAEARERVRQAQHVIGGGHPDAYEPREYPNLHIDDQARPWPTLEG